MTSRNRLRKQRILTSVSDMRISHPTLASAVHEAAALSPATPPKAKITAARILPWGANT
jgi:hypothetical protein